MDYGDSATAVKVFEQGPAPGAVRSNTKEPAAFTDVARRIEMEASQLAKQAERLIGIDGLARHTHPVIMLYRTDGAGGIDAGREHDIGDGSAERVSIERLEERSESPSK